MKKQRDTPSEEEELDLSIDMDMLDHEWLGQPKLFLKYATKLADAKKDLDVAKSSLDVVEAETNLMIREDPEKHISSKVTETSIKSAVLLHPDYMAAQRRLTKARHRVDVLQAAVTALDQRKKALENLVALHGQSYFASPRAPEGSRETVKEMEKRAILRRSKVR